MNIERTNETENEVEFVEKETEFTSRKITKTKILIFIACLIFSFVVWCYANYLDDPIIKKDLQINFSWDSSDRNVSFVAVDAEGKRIDFIEVYGEQSKVYPLDKITVKIKQSQFVDGNDTIEVEIELPDDVHSHTQKITVMKIVK